MNDIYIAKYNNKFSMHVAIKLARRKICTVHTHAYIICKHVI